MLTSMQLALTCTLPFADVPQPPRRLEHLRHFPASSRVEQVEADGTVILPESGFKCLVRYTESPLFLLFLE